MVVHETDLRLGVTTKPALIPARSRYMGLGCATVMDLHDRVAARDGPAGGGKWASNRRLPLGSERICLQTVCGSGRCKGILKSVSGVSGTSGSNPLSSSKESNRIGKCSSLAGSQTAGSGDSIAGTTSRWSSCRTRSSHRATKNGCASCFSNSHRACRDACTTTSPALGPGRAATTEEAVDTHSNARFGSQVEWNVSGTMTFSGAMSNWSGSTAALITDRAADR